MAHLLADEGNAEPCLFREALYRYIDALSHQEQEQQREFLKICQDTAQSYSNAQDVQGFIEDTLARQTDSKGMIKTLVNRIVNALKDYEEIINTLGKRI